MGAELQDIYQESLEKIKERENLIFEKLEEMNSMWLMSPAPLTRLRMIMN